MLEINNIYNGNSLELLKQLDDNSIDSIVTDPPYELGFMGKSWDKTGITYNIDLWKECLRILKPGGHLLSFSGTRTYHRMACAIEDAGFEIRDQIQWIYGSGFPKSMNISKAIDKKFGAEREVIGTKRGAGKNPKGFKYDENGQSGGHLKSEYNETAPATDEAKKWDGWGTALKPANEPIVMARKPLSEKTVADNVLKWHTSGINIDDCRIALNGEEPPKGSGKRKGKGNTYQLKDWHTENGGNTTPQLGRFPANVILDEESGNFLDEQSEGASRFFYCAKVSKKERGEGNNHPTVKPIKLMQYLIRLITPPNGIVLDPFSGSGSTLLAAKNENKNYIGFELNEEYIEIIINRLKVCEIDS
jgi:site-specific DNA-methyltransferase (adenine-specific)